jgi:predicted enzyme related to lactoylglutathione lyase
LAKVTAIGARVKVWALRTRADAGEFMKRVTGIGGVFFKARDAAKLRAWYEQHLGFKIEDYGGTHFKWRDANDPEKTGSTVWSIFPEDTLYFDPSQKPYMINYRVEDLDALLEQLRDEGVEVEDRIEEQEYGRFAWVMDPEGNRIELWEPPPGW